MESILNFGQLLRNNSRKHSAGSGEALPGAALVLPSRPAFSVSCICFGFGRYTITTCD